MSERFEKLREALAAEIVEIELLPVAATYPAIDAMPIEEARPLLRNTIDAFIRAALAWDARQHSDNLFIQHGLSETDNPPPVHAICATTGLGKTQEFAAVLAPYLLARWAAGDTRPWLYLTPTHRLNDKTAQHFRSNELSTQVYRSRNASDPNIPENMELPKHIQVRMCLEHDKVALARACGKNIDTACCKSKGQQCPSYDLCGYQRQFEGDKPHVFLAAHNMLFHPQKLFKDVAGITVDETFYTRGMTGMEHHHEDEAQSVFMIGALGGDQGNFSALDCHAYWRDDLICMLHEHPLGGLARDRFAGKISVEDCSDNTKDEWDIVQKVTLTPEMSADEIAEIKEHIPTLRRARYMAGVWHALRELLEMPEGTISGRLVLEEHAEGKVLRRRGVREVIEARKVPTLLLDATLPDVSILETWYPQVEVVAEIEVQMPACVSIRQVLGGPVSQGKLEVKRNRTLIRRFILQRWIETERKPMVVICQMGVEEWLKQAGLPETIGVEHFNNISGLDDYKHVRSLISIGRTIPGPEAVEAYAGALSGREPLKEIVSGLWYGRVTRGIRLASGGGIGVECDEHIDQVGEAIRLQICERELIQALGRARGINRTPETPLDIDILADVVLPVTVDEVLVWQEPSAAVEMAIEGIALTSPKDMAKAWPGVWANIKAAERTLKKLRTFFLHRDSTPSSLRATARAQRHFPIEESLYRKMSLSYLYTTATTKFRRAVGFFDPRILPHPRPWLAERLGKIVDLAHIIGEGQGAALGGESAVIANAQVGRAARESLPEPQATWRPWAPPPGVVLHAGGSTDGHAWRAAFAPRIAAAQQIDGLTLLKMSLLLLPI
jgi:putative DNA primase/helicase